MIKILSALSLLLIATAVFAQSEKPPQAFLDGVEAEQNSDYKTAASHFRQSIAEKPGMVSAHYHLGRALVQQELHGEALDAFNELIKLEPQNLLAHYEIGKLHLATKNYYDAVAKYRWLKSQTGNPQMVRQIGLMICFPASHEPATCRQTLGTEPLPRNWPSICLI